MLRIIKKNGSFYLAYLLVLAIATYLLLNYSRTETLLWVNGHNNSFLDVFFKYYTNLGDGLVFIIICVILFFRNKWYAFMGILSFAVTSIVSQLFKQVIFPSSPRPYAVIHDSQVLHLVQGVEIHLTNSFPSGHTMTAFSIAVLLTYISKKPWLPFIYLIYAIGVAYSRMYLAQHFLVDVSFGSLIGVVVTLGSILAVEKIYETKKGKIL